jgi:hypothetical protein
VAVFATLLAAVGAALGTAEMASAEPSDERSPGERIEDTCGSLHPYYGLARFPRNLCDRGDDPAIAALQATDGDASCSELVLATQRGVGAVFGLARDAARGHLCAADYHKRGARFGPLGRRSDADRRRPAAQGADPDPRRHRPDGGDFRGARGLAAGGDGSVLVAGRPSHPSAIRGHR